MASESITTWHEREKRPVIQGVVYYADHRYGHETEGPVLATGEASCGLSNQWSLDVGAVLAGDYNALAAGAG